MVKSMRGEAGDTLAHQMSPPKQGDIDKAVLYSFTAHTSRA